jgi:hypothetical protein
MTAPENFILRWVRLKRDANTPRDAEVVGDAQRLSMVDASVGNADATIAQPPIDAAADEPFDLASLPSIDAITVDTDIRAFLQSHVPAELTRAALRQAWASDPAIRDFIGIAESQWDFNDPNAIPGFGPLQATGDVPALLPRVLGGLDKLAELVPEMPVPAEQSPSALTDCEPAALDHGLQQAFSASPSTNHGIHSPREVGSGEGAATKSDRVAEGEDSMRNHRAHGGALPQ